MRMCSRCHKSVRECDCASPGKPRRARLPDSEPWRQELAARTANYRERRTRRENEAEARRADVRRRGMRESESTDLHIVEIRPTLGSGASEPLAEPVRLRRMAAAPPRFQEEATVRVLEPAPAAPTSSALPFLIPPPVPELAEPVARTPRMPASLPAHAIPIEFLQIPLPMPALPEAAGSGAPAAIHCAPLAARTWAGCIDVAVVAAASFSFALAAWMTPGFELPHGHGWKLLLPAFAGVPAVMAAVYTLLCFYAIERTVGMAAAGLEVRALEGAADPVRLRRRARLSLLSLAALGVGYLWVFCDGQRLSWHDSIAGTFIARRECE